MLAWDEIAVEVAAGMEEAGFPVAITRSTADEGAYDVMNGTYATASVQIDGFAVVRSASTVADAFPDYVIGPGDEALLVQAASARENDRIVMQGRTMVVRRAKDITGAGFLWAVIAR